MSSNQGEPTRAEQVAKLSGGTIRRGTKIQLALFVSITLIGVAYVSAEYVGLTRNLFGSDGCTVSADFADSGGIFQNAEVTYRGVTVGRVGALQVRGDGVRVDLNIEDCGASKIPATAAARVTNRSVVGEQYVDLLPPDEKGPYFKGGENIPLSRNAIPTSTQELLQNISALTKSISVSDLQVTVRELGDAFNDRGAALASLLDATNEFVDSARDNLDPTIALLDSSATVLQTQLDEAPALRSFTNDLALLTGQLKASDPDIRRLLNSSPQLNTIRSFISDNRTDFAVTFANLAELGDLLVRYRDGLEQVLELYPVLAGGGPTVLHDNQAALGQVVQTVPDPPQCGDPKKGREGYGGTTRRSGDQLDPQQPNVAARCTAPVSSGVNIRGSAHVPGGDPVSVSGGGIPYPRVESGNLVVSTHLQQASSTPAWRRVLTDALH